MARTADPDDAPVSPTATTGAVTADSGLGNAVGEARPIPAGLALARARAASALFGEDAQAAGLGRFRVLERLGAGGMGVVYAAYDPELDRGVALKLVAVPARGRDAALAEAKALARLSHPNVVPVFDVGVAGDHLYIVMELVRGETLRHWPKGRDRDDVLDAYRQAGEALAAAHAAGLVHRDFKPDNVIVGSDGRVRVVDFGLAVDAADPGRPGDEGTTIAGTPRYMAPEQRVGAAATAAVDQYSFSVALEETLVAAPAGEVPVVLPKWLAAVIERGRATKPEDRFPSMRDLLRALGRDPTKIRRRRITIAAAAIVSVGAAFAGGAAVTGGEEVCASGAAELTSAWNPVARALAVARVATLGDYGRSVAPQLAASLARHSARWVVAHRDACLAHRRGAQSDMMLDRRMVCLERGRSGLRAVKQIVGSATSDSLDELALAVSALPDPDACGDVEALLADIALPPAAIAARVKEVRDRVEQARVQVAAGRYADARTQAAGAVADARATGYRPLLAEALLVAGNATMQMNQAESVPLLAEATKAAIASGSDAAAIEAWARRAWAQGTDASADTATALAGFDLVEALAERTPSARFARALLYNNVGGVELTRGRRIEARAAFERALAESRAVSGPGAVELVLVRTSLAFVTDDPAERDALLEESERVLTGLIGADHPVTLQARTRRVSMMRQLAASADVLRTACEQYEKHHDPSLPTATCWVRLGFLRYETGDEVGALAAMERAAALAARSQDGSIVMAPLEAPAYVALWRGAARDAVALLERVLDRYPKQQDEPWWIEVRRAELDLALGRARAAAGDRAGAARALDPAIAMLRTVAADHPSAHLEHRLARARAELAFVLAAGDPQRAAVLAEEALRWMRTSGITATELQRLERVASHRLGGGTSAE